MSVRKAALMLLGVVLMLALMHYPSFADEIVDALYWEPLNIPEMVAVALLLVAAHIKRRWLFSHVPHWVGLAWMFCALVFLTTAPPWVKEDLVHLVWDSHDWVHQLIHLEMYAMVAAGLLVWYTKYVKGEEE